MAFSAFPQSLKHIAISLVLFSTLLFFFLTIPRLPSQVYPSSSPLVPHRFLLPINTTTSTNLSCSSIKSHSNGLFNYFFLHFCLFYQNPFLSIPSLALILILQFYILIKTAQNYFSIITTKLCFHLNLSPSMAAVTLLALGNGAPDVFASVAAVRRGQYRTGFGAILSAGTFVSAFVVGFVAIYAAPFSLNPVPFVRDVLFYLIAALFLFYVYLSAEIYLWQAAGFVAFYLFFVGFVFWMDLGIGGAKGKSRVGEGQGQMSQVELDCEIGEVLGNLEKGKPVFGFRRAFGMVSPNKPPPPLLLLLLSSSYMVINDFHLNVRCSLF